MSYLIQMNSKEVLEMMNILKDTFELMICSSDEEDKLDDDDKIIQTKINEDKIQK